MSITETPFEPPSIIVELADDAGSGVVIVTYLPSMEIFSTYVPGFTIIVSKFDAVSIAV